MKITITPLSTPEASQLPVPLEGKIKDRFTELCKAIHSEITKDKKFVITLGEEAATLFRAMDWRGMQVPEGLELDGAKGIFMQNANHVICKSDSSDLEELVVVSPVSDSGLFTIGDTILSMETAE